MRPAPFTRRGSKPGRTPRILDLYCCEGGASKGYYDAGFVVVGIDLDPQPRYPFAFLQTDALEALRTLLHGDALIFAGATTGRPVFAFLEDFDAIHGSPPCQAHSEAWRLQKNDHPELIGPTRDLLIQTGLPYVIENVEGARDELLDPVTLCGAAFGIETYRHRLFETNWTLDQPEHVEHVAPQAKMGRPAKPGEFLHIVGNFSGVERGREIMGMKWASRDGLREAIPPVYSEWVGQRLLAVL